MSDYNYFAVTPKKVDAYQGQQGRIHTTVDRAVADIVVGRLGKAFAALKQGEAPVNFLPLIDLAKQNPGLFNELAELGELLNKIDKDEGVER